MNSYEEILYLSHFEPSSKHIRMSMYNRSAQFAPFAALTGFDEKIENAKVINNEKIELSEDKKEILNMKLNNMDLNSKIRIIYFLKDKIKSGGKYINKIGSIKKIDRINKIIYIDNQIINISNILDIEEL